MNHPPSRRRVREAERVGHLPVSPVAVGLAGLAVVAAVLALGGARGLVGAIATLAEHAWRGDANAAMTAASDVLPSLAGMLFAAWSGAVVVGLIQSRVRIARPGRRREPDRRPRRVLEVALGLILLPPVVLLLLDLLAFLTSAVGVSVDHQLPALARAAMGALAALAIASLGLAALHALARRRLWWHALHVDDATHRRERRRDAPPERVLRERRRRWREHRQQAREPDHIALTVVDPATRRRVAIAFHPTLLPVPHVAIAGSLADPAFATLRVPTVDDGPLARALARVPEHRPVPERHFLAVADHFFATGVYVVGAPDPRLSNSAGGAASNV